LTLRRASTGESRKKEGSRLKRLVTPRETGSDRVTGLSIRGSLITKIESGLFRVGKWG